jgi:hypothetical protein
MITDEQITEALQRFIGNMLPTAIIVKVTDNSKAEDEYYVEAEYNELTYDVRLKSVLNNSGAIMLQVPAKDSNILCVPFGDDNYTAVVYDNVERIVYKGENISFDINDKNKATEIKVKEITLKITDQEILINDGSLGGLIKIKELKSDLEKLNSYMDTLKNAISSGLKAVGVSTAASGTIGAQAFDTAIATAQLPSYSKIENEKVKH